MQSAEIVQQVLVRAMAVSVMLSVGLDLSFARLRNVFSDLPALGFGLVHHHVTMPLAAVAIATLFGVPDAVFIGLLLVAAAPGGPVGALFTQHARGDVAYAVTMVFVPVLLSLVLLPVTLRVFAPGGGAVADGFVPQMLSLIVPFQLVPLALAMALRTYRPALADRLLPWIENATKALFGLVAIGMTFARAGLFLTLDVRAVFGSALLVAIALGVGRVATVADRGKRVALSCTAGIRNFALAILVAEAMYSGETQVIVMTYGLCMFLMTIGVSSLYRLRAASPPTAPAPSAEPVDA